MTHPIQKRQRSLEIEAQDCIICLNPMEEGLPAQMLICTHKFHPDCIQEWLNNRTTCPLCRRSDGRVIEDPFIRAARKCFQEDSDQHREFIEEIITMKNRFLSLIDEIRSLPMTSDDSVTQRDQLLKNLKTTEEEVQENLPRLRQDLMQKGLGLHAPAINTLNSLNGLITTSRILRLKL